jgi:hypothetical protein
MEVCAGANTIERNRTENQTKAKATKQLILLPLPSPLFFFCHLSPEKRMSSPKIT